MGEEKGVGGGEDNEAGSLKVRRHAKGCLWHRVQLQGVGSKASDADQNRKLQNRVGLFPFCLLGFL